MTCCLQCALGVDRLGAKSGARRFIIICTGHTDNVSFGKASFIADAMHGHFRGPADAVGDAGTSM